MRLSLIASMLLAGSMAARAEWPQFRGPDGGGHSSATDLPTRWGETDNVAWKAAVEGLGWSSPVVHDDRVYMTTATPMAAEEQSLCLVCLDARTGAERFRKELFRQSGVVPVHKKNSHASPTPVIAGDHVFVHFGPHG